MCSVIKLSGHYKKMFLTIMTISIVTKIITMDIKSSGNHTENHPRRPRSRFQVRGSSAPTHNDNDNDQNNDKLKFIPYLHLTLKIV